MSVVDVFKLMDKYECSGMCKNSLFYYSKYMEEGYPEKSCL